MESKTHEIPLRNGAMEYAQGMVKASLVMSFKMLACLRKGQRVWTVLHGIRCAHAAVTHACPGGSTLNRDGNCSW